MSHIQRLAHAQPDVRITSQNPTGSSPYHLDSTLAITRALHVQYIYLPWV